MKSCASSPRTPEGALEQIALMVMEAGLALPRMETLANVRSVVDVVVQLARIEGERRIVDIRVLDGGAS